MIRDSLKPAPDPTRIGPFYVTEGIHNLRDYGGYAVAGGGRVVRGVLLRSGQHTEASDADLALIESLAIRTVIDLRGVSERRGFPCRRPPGFAARVIAHEGETSNSPPHEGGGGQVEMTVERARERMLAVYRRMPHNPAMHAMFARYFAALAAHEGASLVNCFAGKDRTGIAVSLLLHVLGVHRDDVIAEFLLTNEAPTRHVLERQSLPRMQAHYGAIAPEALDYLMGVHPQYIETFFDEVARAHGSLDDYLAESLGVSAQTRARLRARLVA